MCVGCVSFSLDEPRRRGGAGHGWLRRGRRWRWIGGLRPGLTLSEDPDRSVCLIEAGPDYGPYAEGRWPADLLNAHELAVVSHDWCIEGGWPSWRAKVLGGCSAHNGCFVVWGPPADYDDWAQTGDPGWSHAALDPYRRRCEQTLRTRPSRVEDLEPFNRAGLDAAVELGLPLLEDFDDPQATEGAAPIKVNAVGAVRWNAAFAYLDPARGRPNLTIMPDTLVDRLHLEGSRVAGLFVRVDGRVVEVAAAGSCWPPAPTARPRCCCEAAWDLPRSWPRHPSRPGPICPLSGGTSSITRR